MALPGQRYLVERVDPIVRLRGIHRTVWPAEADPQEEGTGSGIVDELDRLLGDPVVHVVFKGQDVCDGCHMVGVFRPTPLFIDLLVPARVPGLQPGGVGGPKGSGAEA